MSKATVKVYVDVDERYPDYILSDEQGYGDDVLEVDAKTLERWLRVHGEYNEVADEIFAALKATR